MHKRSGPVSDAATGTYKRLVRAVLSRQAEDEGSEYAATITLLREVLYRLASQYRVHNSNADRSSNSDIEELLMATHYTQMMYSARSFGLKEIACKAAVTLLKYPFVVPQDKAFYQAGNACRDIGNTNFAFMLLNRYHESICYAFYTFYYLIY